MYDKDNHSPQEQEPLDKLKELQRRQGEFIAHSEIAQANMEQWQQTVEQQLSQHRNDISSQLNDIQQRTEELGEIMTEAGAARFRLAAEQALSQGHTHLQALEKYSKRQTLLWEESQQAFSDAAKEQQRQLRQTEHQVICHIQEVINRLELDDVHQMLDDSREAVELAANESITQSKNLLKRFHFRNIMLVVTVSLFSTLSMGLYISDELPWEIHRHAMEERRAGQALLAAWPKLDASTQHKIAKHSHHLLVTNA